MSVIKTVPVIFVVNTVLIQYCVYYENYWNSLYSTATVIEYINRNLRSQPTVLKRQPPLYAAAPQNARHNASWCNFVDCIIFSTRRLELRERRQNALLQHDWSIVNWVKRPWIVGTIYEFRDFRHRRLLLDIQLEYQILYPNLNLWI